MENVELEQDFVGIVIKQLVPDFKKQNPIIGRALSGFYPPKDDTLNIEPIMALELSRRHFSLRNSKFDHPAYYSTENIEKFAEPTFVAREFATMLKKFDKKLNKRHLKKCPYHQFKYDLYLIGFIKALHGHDFEIEHR